MDKKQILHVDIFKRCKVCGEYGATQYGLCIECWEKQQANKTKSGSDNNIITDNTWQSNGESGILLDSADNNTITDNTWQSNGESGFYLGGE